MVMMLVAFMVVVVRPGSELQTIIQKHVKIMMFNAMMQNGMQFYMFNTDVNR